MNDWPQQLTLIYSVLAYHMFLRPLLGGWLQQGFVREGRMAEMQRSVFNALVKVWLVPPIVLPAISVEKLTSAPLPQGFTVRLCQPEDSPSCLEIYRLNAPGRFPEEVEQEFAALLEKDGGSMLVIEKDGRILACGGAALQDGTGGLHFGLIHPDFQKQGIGRLLLMARLVRFDCAVLAIHIYSVADSVGYYERYGFRRFGLWYSHDGGAHPVAGVSLHPENRQKLASFLSDAGYPVPPPLPASTTAG
ncbi:GNAT family N-acetyltransferase [Prosthecobacter fluviatilis]|uniref:GNAT family N-acetyltransferase n=1 Tax=Prosthecobacter fluviatilis TaxID=445931 RepID=A0ABW0KRR9_9BACT